MRDLAPETDYWCKAVATFDGRSFTGEILKFTTEKNPVPDGAVDLGIVMTREDGTTYKLYWATCNLCKDGFVSSPEVYGDYYAWGETEPKENYSWSTYKFGTGSSGTFSKYDTDNKTVLETGPDGDDAASKKLGGRWRMPTDKEWAALRAKCVWEWTDNYNGTGVKGRILTSRISGYTDMSIFLPAAGGRYESGISDIGIWGIYWSSSLYTDRPSQAWYAYFHDGNIGSNYNGSGYSFRSDGYSVRPVCVE